MITSASQTADATPVTAAPRNVEQIRNMQKTQCNASRLSRDTLYNLHEFTYDSNFIHRIVTYPDLSLICYNMSIVKLFSSLLFTATDSDKSTVTMTYDTTFNLGDFYVSVLLFRETDFHPSPIVLLAYVILDTILVLH